MGKRGPKPGSAKLGEEMKLRLEAGLKKQLEMCAAQAGRSVSEEIRLRLKASFSAAEFQDAETKSLAVLIALALEVVREQSGHAWFENPWAFKHARDAIDEVLGYLEPHGVLCVPEDHPTVRSLRAQGLDDFTAKAKEQLENSTMGKLAGISAIALIEAVAAGDASEELDHLRPLAELVKAQLVKGHAAGAIDDLRREAGKPGAGVKL